MESLSALSKEERQAGDGVHRPGDGVLGKVLLGDVEYVVAVAVLVRAQLALADARCCKRAGIGVGTLYRHFPSRDALLAARLQAQDEDLVRSRDAICESQPDAAEAVARWPDAPGQWATAFDGLLEPLRAALGDTSNPLALTCQGNVADTQEFLTAAQDEGTARAGVRAMDLFLVVLATRWASSAALADGRAPHALASLVRRGGPRGRWGETSRAAATARSASGARSTDPTSCSHPPRCAPLALPLYIRWALRR